MSGDFVGWVHVILSHHSATVEIHRHCKSGDATIFICHVTTWSKYQLTLLFWSIHPESPTCYVWEPWALWKCRYNVFFICHVITWSRFCVTLLVGFPHPEPPPHHVWELCESGITAFFISHVTTWLCWYGSVILSHHSVKLGGHRFTNRFIKVYKWLS